VHKNQKRSQFLVSCYGDGNNPRGVLLAKRSSYVCLDEAPEGRSRAAWTDEKAQLLPVEVLRDQRLCSTYSNGQDVNCVVCSK